MSASSALQKAISEALVADAAVGALVGGRIYEVPPDGAQHPYISFGPSSYYPERRDCHDGRIESFQVNVWTEDQREMQPCKEICDAVVSALDMANLSLEDPYSLSRINLQLGRILSTPNGITKHGVLQFECEINE